MGVLGTLQPCCMRALKLPTEGLHLLPVLVFGIAQGLLGGCLKLQAQGYEVLLVRPLQGNNSVPMLGQLLLLSLPGGRQLLLHLLLCLLQPSQLLLVLLLKACHLLRGVPLKVALPLLQAAAELPNLRHVLLSHQLCLCCMLGLQLRPLGLGSGLHKAQLLLVGLFEVRHPLPVLPHQLCPVILVLGLPVGQLLGVGLRQLRAVGLMLSHEPLRPLCPLGLVPLVPLQQLPRLRLVRAVLGLVLVDLRLHFGFQAFHSLAHALEVPHVLSHPCLKLPDGLLQAGLSPLGLGFQCLLPLLSLTPKLVLLHCLQ
mmetsp:Transcript_60897/g.108668  ORF Transcript_60897/g.108668 Transcript_60897/m.108668 type:complete len:312 (+) Transcript_60897:971-1906(+)